MKDSKKIAVIGLGYVGLPLFVKFSQKYDTLGFDINKKKNFRSKKKYRHNFTIKNERI